MAKATPAYECSPENCGDNFPNCGIPKTYKAYGCRCVECRRARREDSQRERDRDPQRATDKQRAYIAANREAVAERKRRYRAENREAVLEYSRRYNTENAEANRERSRRYREANLEKVKAANRKWRAENDEYVRDYGKRYRMENREAVHQRTRDWVARNQDVVRMHRQSRRALLLAAWIEDVELKVLFERDGYICQHCGIACQTHTYKVNGVAQLDYATHDHIVPLSWGVFRGGFHSYANSQTLCLDCNNKKHNCHNN